MRLPDPSETIVALATAWQASPIGVLRVSGPRAFALIASLIVGGESSLESPRYPRLRSTRLTLDGSDSLPVDLLLFRAPRSYTGQDLIELHLPGCLPLLRHLADELARRGARPALPGEFTARAFAAGKLDRSRVDGVLALIHAQSESATLAAARLAAGAAAGLAEQVGQRLLDLLARLEAGIDFVDEEDVRFISTREARRELADLARIIADATAQSRAVGRAAARAHVALVGLPNAGKSTLFNALLGYERAIVSPVIGTTRDVLSADLLVEGCPITLQDTAGLGAGDGELDLASHRAAEQSSERADLVLWVHDAAREWSTAELNACARIPADRRLHVASKLDLSSTEALTAPPNKLGSVESIGVCALSGVGLLDLRAAIAERVATLSGGAAHETEWSAAEQHIRSSLAQLDNQPVDDGIAAPELLAMELRAAIELLQKARTGMPEAILERIFSRFCIGK